MTEIPLSNDLEQKIEDYSLYEMEYFKELEEQDSPFNYVSYILKKYDYSMKGYWIVVDLVLDIYNTAYQEVDNDKLREYLVFRDLSKSIINNYVLIGGKLE